MQTMMLKTERIFDFSHAIEEGDRLTFHMCRIFEMNNAT